MTENLLTCPIRGKLKTSSLAKDGLTVTEEARRIEFLTFLLQRGYPKDLIDTEIVVVKNLGESGRNKLRADVIVYEEPLKYVRTLPLEERLKRAVLIAEIKRDSTKKNSGIACQLKPAMAQLPGLKVMGAYWDDVTRSLFIKKLMGTDGDHFIEIIEDSLEQLPPYGRKYKTKPITIGELSPPTNLVATLFSVANVMRSHGINDEQLRYKETVKLILARYCDERGAASTKSKELSLQTLVGSDPEFMDRVDKVYGVAAKRYAKAKSLFHPVAGSELPERTLREIVRSVQGIAFTKAGNDTMQQIFLSFVPTVFKKNLDQYFTPLTLIDTIVQFVQIGPNDKVADPAMGTADFLTAAMEYRQNKGDDDMKQRIYGVDVDSKAYDLAIINMILNRDGESNLKHEDSIANHALWAEEIDVALCNPPFGENSIENRPSVLKHYDLGHQWTFDPTAKRWKKQENLPTQPSQHLGLLFIERCYKLLAEDGRMAIILPEGYLCTASYGYVRQWILDHFRIISLVELPRRIFLKSNADLRSNILVAQKLSAKKLKEAVDSNYPIYTDLVRKVGYKLGSGFAPIQKMDPETGDELRDENNHVILDSDFRGVRDRFETFTSEWKWNRPLSKQPSVPQHFAGGTIRDILEHPNLDMKARRLMPNALGNKRKIWNGKHLALGKIADVLTQTFDLAENPSSLSRLVEGMDIRANEGVVIPQFPARHWQIADKKGRMAYRLRAGDIIIGLVRPERRNIGLLLHKGEDIIGSPDGIAVVRIKEEWSETYRHEWVFAELRSERTRLQLWTESGGTSYGKLTPGHIENVQIAVPSKGQIEAVRQRVRLWANSFSDAFEHWDTIGLPEDRRPIINSAIIGLEVEDS